jgi:phage shock protein A
MSKHGIIGRVTQLARANVNATISSAADPREMADQLVRDYTTTIAEAEQAVAQLAGNLCIAEDDQHQDAEAVVQWGRNAEAASQTADELRATGDAAEADRLDYLARVALRRQMIAENDVESVRHTIAAQHESIDKLKNGLGQMQIRLSELMAKQDSAPAQSRPGRARTGTAPGAPPPGEQPREAVRSADIMDPASEVARFEEQLRREVASVRSGAELPVSSEPDEQFPSLDELANQAEIGERLQALKAGRAMASARARARDQPIRHDHPLR